MTAPQHPTVDLGAHALGLLDGAEARAVEAHLAGCPVCRTEFEELRDMSAMLDDMPPEAFLEGPPDSDLVLARTLRQMRGERSARGRRRVLSIAAAAVVVAGAVLGGGWAIGRATAPAPAVVAQPAGTITLTGAGVDGATMNATISPAKQWIRLVANVKGIPVGERCRIIVVARDGTREQAGGWVVPATAETGGVTLNGSAAIAIQDVASVVVQNVDGKEFVHLNA